MSVRGGAHRRERVLLALAALLLLGCLLDPSWPIERRLYDPIVVIDITQSMNVEDVPLTGASDAPAGVAARPVSRLSAARQAVHALLPQLPCGSKLGLALFTGNRSLLLLEPVEVCAHRRELRSSLDAIDGRMAWMGASEIAKGLNGALNTAAQLPGDPTLLFFTDGHEAPPLHPGHRPRPNLERGKVGGLVVGVGGSALSRIPKFDPSGQPLGHWEAEEVLQVDPRSQGRAGSVGGEALVEEGGAEAPAAATGATPGQEHLSALREAYLQLLADERGLGYVRLDDLPRFVRAAMAPDHVRPVLARTSLAPLLGVLALLLLLARHLDSLPAAATALRRRASGLFRRQRDGGTFDQRPLQSAVTGMRKTGSI